MLAIRRLAQAQRSHIKLWLLCAGLVVFQSVSSSHTHAVADNAHSQVCGICLLTQNAGAPAYELPHLPLHLPQNPAPAIETVAAPALFYYSSHSPRAPPI